MIVDPLLFVHATAHTDIETQRIAMGNRVRVLTATEPDSDGIMRGYALPPDHPDVARLIMLRDALAALEKDSARTLKACLRRCSIAPWIQATNGLGAQQTARLLGVIGDPYWHVAEQRPRTVSELWAYSGLHVTHPTLPGGRGPTDTQRQPAAGAQTLAGHGGSDTLRRNAGETAGGDHGHSTPGVDHDAHVGTAGVAARHRKGQKSNWSNEAKTRAYLCATSCVKVRTSPYRPVYLERRAHTAITHPEWTAGHSHNDGLRITAKRILRDLWREARRLHQDHPDKQED